MADDKSDLESLKRQRSNAQRIFTTRVNRLDKLLDASNEYVDAQSQIDPTDDDSELRDALAKRNASEQKFIDIESRIMEMLWSKYVEPDIDALVEQFKSAFDRAEALSTTNMPWMQQGVESGKLDRKLHKLRDALYTWRDYRPHGRDKWMLFLSLREDREQLTDGRAYKREHEVIKRNSTELEGDGEEAEGEDGRGGGHVRTGIDSLTAADSITITQPATVAVTTPPVNSQPAIVDPPIEWQRTVYITGPPSFMSTDRASKYAT